jgi:peptide deformylase
MIDTMRAVGGVGLAAPQVGEGLRIVVLEDRPEAIEKLSPARRHELKRVPFAARVLINPSFELDTDEEETHFEDCLSVPGLHAMVSRWTAIRVTGVDAEKKAVDERWSGWQARILQHEVDHLNGVLFTDRMKPETLTTTANRDRWFKGRSAEEADALIADTALKP